MNVFCALLGREEKKKTNSTKIETNKINWLSFLESKFQRFQTRISIHSFLANHVQGDTNLLNSGVFSNQFVLCADSFLCILQIFTIFIAVIVTTCLAQRALRYRNKSKLQIIFPQFHSK